jgi:hypothetical protein
MAESPTIAVIEGDLKYLTNLTSDSEHDCLFDIRQDPAETDSVIGSHAEDAKRLRSFLEEFIDSARASHAGNDYPGSWAPITEFQEPSDW